MQSDITDISGMSTLSGITGKLTIINNPLLTSLQGLENLEEIQGNSLVIHNNASLTSIEELKNLTQDQGGNLEVTDNLNVFLAGAPKVRKHFITQKHGFVMK